MSNALPVPYVDPALEIAALARRYRRAGGPVITLANRVGAQLDEALRQFPAGARGAVEATTAKALAQAFKVAQAGGRFAPRTGRGGRRRWRL